MSRLNAPLTPADTKTPPAKHVSKQHGKQHTKNIHKTAHHHSAAGTSVAK